MSSISEASHDFAMCNKKHILEAHRPNYLQLIMQQSRVLERRLEKALCF